MSGAASDIYFDPDDVVRPAPRSTPWPKCCSVCAFLPHDPQHLGTDVIAMLKTDVVDDVIDFYCVHRTNRSGKHRICAGAHAYRRAHLLNEAQP